MRQHIEPVIDAIKFLPCQDLAHIAEMLVNVSSFHASMMPGQNFIGGNIDVATLAKGYGFQWIKKPDGHAVNINNVRRLDL